MNSFGTWIGKNIHLSEVEKLLSKSFPVLSGGSFFDDFPVWENSELKGLHLFSITESDQVIGVGGLREAQLKLSGDRIVRTGLVGAIAVAEEYQAKGLGRRILESLLQKAVEQSLEAIFLWSPFRGFYSNFGFKEFGSQFLVPVSEILKVFAFANVRREDSPEVRKVGEVDFQKIRQRVYGLELHDEDKVWWLRHRNTRWAFSGESYAAFGRGIDLQGLIHEWPLGIDGFESAMKKMHSLLKVFRDLQPGAKILVPGFLRKELERLNLISCSQELPMALFLPMRKELGDLNEQRDKVWFWGLDAC